jgi:hypothetical protein
MTSLMTREVYATEQKEYLDEIFSACGAQELKKTNRGLMQLFMSLSLDTYDELSKSPKRLVLGIASMHPDSGWNYVGRLSCHQYMSKGLVERWRLWAKLYPDIVAANPLLEMHDLLWDWSENLDGSSWPWQYEMTILKHIESGDFSADQADCVRLKQLRDMTGKWLIKDDNDKLVCLSLHKGGGRGK